MAAARIRTPVLFIGVACGDDQAEKASKSAPADQVASTLFDLSGLAWLGEGQFLAVHDAKDPDELERPRVSLLTFPQGPQGLMWKEAVIDWPTDLGPSSDLESASTIPGTQDVLFAESGDDAHEDPAFQRIFLASVEGDEWF